ncbi:MAG: Uma2 family endonuclease [Roseiflexaceae bacterium]|nr:Uma2 family endonuclease [Roseiflexaceae bacterium]
MSVQSTTLPSIADYLAFERASSEKHEYAAGQIIAQAGASERHNLITGSLYAAVYTQLRTRPCTVYSSDMRVKVSQTGLYTYPDLSILCGQPLFDDTIHDTLLNPMVLIEILSPSTERYDRGKKFQHYRTIETLQEYILIAQDEPYIDQYIRHANDMWLLSSVAPPAPTLTIASVGCTVLIADIYEKISFNQA